MGGTISLEAEEARREAAAKARAGAPIVVEVGSDPFFPNILPASSRTSIIDEPPDAEDDDQPTCSKRMRPSPPDEHFKAVPRRKSSMLAKVVYSGEEPSPYALPSLLERALEDRHDARLLTASCRHIPRQRDTYYRYHDIRLEWLTPTPKLVEDETLPSRLIAKVPLSSAELIADGEDEKYVEFLERAHNRECDYYSVVNHTPKRGVRCRLFAKRSPESHGIIVFQPLGERKEESGDMTLEQVALTIIALADMQATLYNTFWKDEWEKDFSDTLVSSEREQLALKDIARSWGKYDECLPLHIDKYNVFFTAIFATTSHLSYRQFYMPPGLVCGMMQATMTLNDIGVFVEPFSVVDMTYAHTGNICEEVAMLFHYYLPYDIRKKYHMSLIKLYYVQLLSKLNRFHPHYKRLQLCDGEQFDKMYKRIKPYACNYVIAPLFQQFERYQKKRGTVPVEEFNTTCKTMEKKMHHVVDDCFRGDFI